MGGPRGASTSELVYVIYYAILSILFKYYTISNTILFNSPSATAAASFLGVYIYTSGFIALGLVLHCLNVSTAHTWRTEGWRERRGKGWRGSEKGRDGRNEGRREGGRVRI